MSPPQIIRIIYSKWSWQHAPLPRGELHHPHNIHVSGQKFGPKARPQARLEFSGREHVGPVGPVSPIYFMPRVRRVDFESSSRNSVACTRPLKVRVTCCTCQDVVELFSSRADPPADRSRRSIRRVQGGVASLEREAFSQSRNYVRWFVPSFI